MNRKAFLKYTLGSIGASLCTPWESLMAQSVQVPYKALDFGKDFKWGVATAAYQIEGAWDKDGKGESIWDHFTHQNKKKIKDRTNGDVACDFYHKYVEDIELVREMNFKVFRFSIAWTRILPDGTGAVNQKGLDFYHKVIDKCLSIGIEPWITIYHWDLPQVLEKKGGWANRAVLDWFENYADIVTKEFGAKVKNWMVLNEPAAFTAVGYLAGVHAPGKVAPKKFLKVAHHATLAQADGGRIIRKNVPNAYIGTTFSCSPVEPKNSKPKHEKAAHRADALLNRLFIEPLLGLGYPTEDFKFLKKIERYVQPGDMERAQFNFDFIGLQNYTRTVIKKAFIPYVWMLEEKAEARDIAEEAITEMGWEVYPEGIYKILKQFDAYKNLPPILITENGAAFDDNLEEDRIRDKERIAYFETYLGEILRAKQEGIDIRGYFVWTLMDNFEWAEGYKARFGLVHIEQATLKRRIKDSGNWFKSFLAPIQ